MARIVVSLAIRNEITILTLSLLHTIMVWLTYVPLATLTLYHLRAQESSVTESGILQHRIQIHAILTEALSPLDIVTASHVVGIELQRWWYCSTYVILLTQTSVPTTTLASAVTQLDACIYITGKRSPSSDRTMTFGKSIHATTPRLSTYSKPPRPP